jgi:hypothetical protein
VVRFGRPKRSHKPTGEEHPVRDHIRRLTPVLRRDAPRAITSVLLWAGSPTSMSASESCIALAERPTWVEFSRAGQGGFRSVCFRRATVESRHSLLRESGRKGGKRCGDDGADLWLTQRDGLGPAATRIFDGSLLITAPPTLCVLWYPVIPKCVPWCPDRNPSVPGRSRCNAMSSYPAAEGRSRPCRPAPDRGSSEESPCTRREYMGRHNNRVLLNLCANRWVTSGSNHCKCSLNQHMLDDSMTTARPLSLKTR